MQEIQQIKADEVEWPLRPRGQAPLSWAIDSQDAQDITPQQMNSAMSLRAIGRSFRSISQSIGVSEWIVRRSIREQEAA